MPSKRIWFRLGEDETELLRYAGFLRGKCMGEYARQIIELALYRETQEYEQMYQKMQSLIAERINKVVNDGR